jgi:hypothetical protein
VIQYRELNANVAKQCHNNDIPLARAPIKRITRNPRPEVMTLEDVPKWFSMPNGELKNHIARGFKIYADYTDYVNYDEYFGLCKDAKYIRYKPVAIQVTAFQCHK